MLCCFRRIQSNLLTSDTKRKTKKGKTESASRRRTTKVLQRKESATRCLRHRQMTRTCRLRHRNEMTQARRLRQRKKREREQTKPQDGLEGYGKNWRKCNTVSIPIVKMRRKAKSRPTASLQRRPAASLQRSPAASLRSRPAASLQRWPARPKMTSKRAKVLNKGV